MSGTTLILLFLLAALGLSSCRTLLFNLNILYTQSVRIHNPESLALALFFAETVTSIQPEIAVRVLPPDNGLNTFTFLVCNLEPNSQLTQSDYVSRWTVPSGGTFTYLVPNPPGFERFRTFQGPARQGVQRESTLLFVERLSYKDAGNYTCEVRSSASAQSPWFSASVELQLKGKDTFGWSTAIACSDYIFCSGCAGQCEQCDCTHQ